MGFMEEFVQAAIAEARISLEEGGIPVGSVLVHGDKIIGRGHNRRLQDSSVIRHGEMDALENAGRQSPEVYRNCTLFTTLSPCPMCAGAIRLYGIPTVIIGENRNYHGDEELLEDRDVKLIVLQDPTCIDLMHKFIEAHPDVWNEDIGR